MLGKRTVRFLHLGGVLLVAAILLFLVQWIGSDIVLAAPTDRFVGVGGTDSGGCTLAASPCATVQYAVDVATGGDAIHVSQGTYTGVQVRSGVTQMVHLSKSLTLRGGYNTTFSEQSPALYPTILDAQGQGRVFYIEGTADITIEGFSITGGDALAGGGGLSSGGGLFAVGDSGPALTITLRHNDVVTNHAGAGGGLSFIFSNVVLDDNRVEYNEASNNGGGLRLEQSNADLWDTLVRFNQADSAGAMQLSTLVNLAMTNTVVADNQATTSTPGIYGGGSTVRLVHSTFARNRGGDGVGIFAGFGFLSGPSTLVLENSVVVSHTVGITVSEGTDFLTSTARLDGVLWYGNGANIDGGGEISVTQAYTGPPRFAPDGYHIELGSQAIDRGVPTMLTVDIDGESRPVGAAPDLGVDELLIYRVFLPLALRNF